MLYLCSPVLDDQVAQGNVVRNVAKLVDRVAGEAEAMRSLTERDMFAILDHNCRDRHLWALALCGLRRGETAGVAVVQRRQGQDGYGQRESGGRGQGDRVRHTQIQGQHADAADAR
jgi:hypothetical protein